MPRLSSACWLNVKVARLKLLAGNILVLMPSHASAPSSLDRTQIYAHRGLAVGQAENTEGAFRRALDAGAHWLETDVNTTADGQVLVFHDPTLNRLVGRPGRVAEMTWGQLRDLNLADGGQIPRLRDMLEAFPETRFNIDLKDAGSAAEVARVLVAAGAVERVRLASFSERRLRQAHRAAQDLGVRIPLSASQPAFTVFYALSRIHPSLWSFLRPITRRFMLPFDAVQVPAYHRVAGRRLRIVDRKLVAAARRAGVQVHVWTVDDERTMRELIALGVNGIVTNRTDLLADVLAS